MPKTDLLQRNKVAKNQFVCILPEKNSRIIEMVIQKNISKTVKTNQKIWDKQGVMAEFDQ